MKIAYKRSIMAVCALSIAEVAMAAIPKSSIDSDVKDTRVANVVATSPNGDTTSYTCDYAWQITFSNGAETTLRVRLEWRLRERGGIGGRHIVVRYGTEDALLAKIHRAEICAANARCVRQHGMKDRLKLAG